MNAIRPLLPTRALVTPVAPAAPPAWVRPTFGQSTARIMVVCDPQSVSAHRVGAALENDYMKAFARAAKPAGFSRDDFYFVALCPPVPLAIVASASKTWKHVEPYVEGIQAAIEAANPDCIVPLGALAARAVLGRAVAITKARGAPIEHGGRMVLPFLSPAFIAKVPDHLPTFESDMHNLARLREAGFRFVDDAGGEVRYEWREDISDVLALRPEMIALDTETTGLKWHDPAVEVILVQITYQPGHTLVCPVHRGYWPAWEGREHQRLTLVGQLRTLLQDKQVQKVGHNLKFDAHMLRKMGIELDGWTHDTQLLAFSIDENMMEKSLDECVRRWVPEMAGYADQFNLETDKSKMLEVPHDKMLPYAGGDTDATFRLWRTLFTRLKRDRRQLNCYARVMMPAMRVFAASLERHGMLIDQNHLQTFQEEVSVWVREEYRALIAMVPAAIRRRHLRAGKELSFTRSDFTKDVLFDPQGFNLTPRVFTKGTAKEEDPTKREPSTSAKDHLPWFVNEPGVAGQFVTRFIDYQKTVKLLGTYIEGFWKYIAPTGRIYPSYFLHRTNTGRTASADPNGQNFPKRGRWAKAYLKIFQASPGYVLINCDLSQIELRLVAWMANEPTMLRIYREGGDIHTATAQAISGIGGNAWAMLPREERKKLRTQAKAVNFGYIYGMGHVKFREYAKTSYDVEYTEAEAKQAREKFFQTYKGLPAWHDRMREYADEYGLVRSMHGAARHLPSITSTDEITRGGAQRQAINAPIQRLGSDLGLIAMSRFNAQADPAKMRIIGFVHDALVMEAKIEHAWDAVSALVWCMQSPPLHEWFGITSPIPILADADIGMNGGDMIELAEVPAPEKRPQWFNDLGWEVNAAGAVVIPPERPVWWSDHVEAEEEARMQLLLAG